MRERYLNREGETKKEKDRVGREIHREIIEREKEQDQERERKRELERIGRARQRDG